MMTTDEMFGRQVKDLREEKGWSMTKLAHLITEAGVDNFHSTTVGRMERGERPVRLAEAVAIAEVFGVDLDSLVVPPLVGDESLTTAMLDYEREARMAAFFTVGVDKWINQIKFELQLTRDSLKHGRFYPENEAQIEETCLLAEQALSEDRVAFWVEKLRSLSPERQQQVMAAKQSTWHELV